MELHPRTIATLTELEKVHWFSCVGVHDSESAEVLSSWFEAVESCDSPEWEELCLEAANQYRARLMERSLSRFNRWNEVVSIVKPLTEDLVRRKTAKTISENNLPNVFLATVQWDILHLCMEAEYADVYPPGFYASQSYWYVKGHFPCGWRGDFPKGNIVIY